MKACLSTLRRCGLALVISAAASAHAQQAGAIDPSFGASLGLAGRVTAIAAQPDGKVIVGGFFQRGVARLNSDGTIDSSFQAVVDLTNGNGSGVNAVAIQSDGKIVLGGGFDRVNGAVIPFGITRLNPDGSRDTGFNATSDILNIRTVAVQADGKILVGRQQGSSSLLRLQSNGSTDTGFAVTFTGSTVLTIALQPDSKIVVGGAFTQANGVACNNLARFNSNGTLDSSFTGGVNDSSVQTLALQSDGKLIVGGAFTVVNGSTKRQVARLNSDGTTDSSFNTTITSGGVTGLAISGDGKIVLIGQILFSSDNRRVARLTPDGTLDSTFGNSSFDKNVLALTLSPDGRVIVGGDFFQVNGVPCSSLVRFATDGSLDTGFVADVTAGPNGTVDYIAPQPDGKYIITGNFTTVNGEAHVHTARLNADGSLDSTFAASPASPNPPYAAAVQSDGKILVGTTFPGITSGPLVRLTSTGALDSAFHQPSIRNGVSGGEVRQITVQADGKVFIVGQFDSVDGVATKGIARLNGDGTADSSFACAIQWFSNAASRVGWQPDSKAIIAGVYPEIGTGHYLQLARLNVNGTTDATFNATALIGPTAQSFVTCLVVQSDGKIVIGNTLGITDGGGMTHNRITRFNADGTVDSAFNPILNGNLQSAAIQPDGKIVIGGDFTTVNGVNRTRIARLNADGSVDSAFDPGVGAGNTIGTIVLQSGGKIVIGGNFTTFNSFVRNYIARLNADGSLDTGFNPGVGAPKIAAIAFQSSNSKVVVGGTFTEAGGQLSNALARLRSDGSADPLFKPPYQSTDIVGALALRADGRVYAGSVSPLGGGNDKNPIRPLDPVTGAFETTGNWPNAGTDGVTNALALQSIPNVGSPYLLVGGGFANLNGLAHANLGRLKDDGNLDLNFNTTCDGVVRAIALQTDGAAIVGGDFTHVIDGSSQSRSHIARIGVNGAIDANFAASITITGTASPTVTATTVQSDGKVLIGGSFTAVGGQTRIGLARLTSAGALDGSFVPPAITRADGGTPQINGVAVQPQDQKIIIAGLFDQIGSTTRHNVARLNVDGSVDITFDPGAGPNDLVRALALQADGRCLIGGDFTTVGVLERTAAARLFGDTLTSQQQWRFINFGTIDPNSSVGGDLAVPYADGVANLLKYALNLSAQGPDATPMTANGIKGLPLPARDISGQHLTLTFVRRKASTNPGITYNVEFRDGMGLQPPFATNPQATENTTSIDNIWERVTVTDSVIIGGQSARFVHLKVMVQ